MHVITGKAVAFGEALQPAFSDYIDLVLENARVLSETVQEHGLRVVSGGTDNHLLLVDLTTAGISGRKAERALEAAGITVNKNAIPNDPEKPFVTSGLRLGTAAVTTAGMGPDEMVQIAEAIVTVLRAVYDDAIASGVKSQIADLCARFTPDPDM